MESSSSSDQQDTAQREASGPSIGFPVGAALVLILIVILSGIISCCYHWHKHKLTSFSHSPPSSTEHLKRSGGQSLPVLMPGDEVPKFLAMPSPKIIITLPNPTPPFH
ncbi:uncharacterized protein G2W53_036248 [Senna tora]|uniref:Hydroxyproline-rich glycoprotein family protein n=1 Tax=Senna tora TaxID=362788 RepID=A0A834SVJ1_9FABA|nr:uncharacterized protein G2W53_036248 [Senna tora]